MVSALDKKLAARSARLRGQAATIALVVACGIAGYVSMQSTCCFARRCRRELLRRDAFRGRLRAPETRAERRRFAPRDDSRRRRGRDARRRFRALAARGHARARRRSRRVAAGERQAGACRTSCFARGDCPTPGRSDEAVLLASFADAHALDTGSTIPAVINGVLRDVRVVGIAMSPEYVFAIVRRGGLSTCDASRVLWMDRDAIARRSSSTARSTTSWCGSSRARRSAGVIERSIAMLAPYGGLGAVPRRRQPSAFMLAQELDQLRAIATLVPDHLPRRRGVLVQRRPRARRRAPARPDRDAQGARIFEPRDRRALREARRRDHARWARRSASVSARGSVEACSISIGRIFELPEMTYRLDLRVTATSVVVSLVAAASERSSRCGRSFGSPPRRRCSPSRRRATNRRSSNGSACRGSRRARPDGDARDARGARCARRSPSLGLSLAVMGLVTSRFGYDAVDAFETMLFETSQRDDLAVTLRNTSPEAAAREIAHVPGVLDDREPSRRSRFAHGAARATATCRSRPPRSRRAAARLSLAAEGSRRAERRRHAHDEARRDPRRAAR